MTDDATIRMEAPDQATSPAATQPVLHPVQGPGPSRARWAIGIGVAGLAIAGIIAAVIVLGSRPTPPALTYIPANAIVVVELRPDLPGDQMQKLGTLLAHFPGFADTSTLPDKLDETFAQLFGSASNGGVDYRGDIKPWLSGAAFIAMLPPSTASAADPTSAFHGVASLTTTGTVSCDAPFESMTVTHETYQGKDLFIGADGSAACVLDGAQALLGDTASVKAALDARAAGSGIDKDAGYVEARASLSGDQLATVYLDGAGYLDMLDDMMALMPSTPDMPDMSAFPGLFPEWVVQGLRAEGDAIVLDSVIEAGAAPAPSAGTAPAPSLLPIPAGHASRVMPFAPAGTILFVESQGVSASVQNAITQLRSIPTYGPMLDMLEEAGDPEDLVGWINDIGLIVANGDAGVSGGVVVVAKDAAAASERVGALKGLLGLLPLQGVSIDSADSTVAGVSVTTYTIGDLGSILGQLAPGVTTPEATLEFSIATKDDVILLTAGKAEAFMTAALTVQGGSGLADQAGYRTATSRALGNSQMTVYVAIRDIVGIVEPLIPAEERSRWDVELKPYFAPFQALSLTTSIDESGSGRSRISLAITNP